MESLTVAEPQHDTYLAGSLKRGKKVTDASIVSYTPRVTAQRAVTLRRYK